MLTDFIKIRVDAAAKLRIQNAASAKGLSMSDYCRMCILQTLDDTDEIGLAAERISKLADVKKAAETVTGVIITKQE